MAIVTREDMVRALKELTTVATPIASSRQLKDWLDANEISWDEPQGWQIKSAEEEEFRSGAPRFIKFKFGPHDNSLVGFALTENDVAAESVARSNGWKRL